jgi:hypothetical protein
MMTEAHTGCETTFFNQNERVKDVPCLCQFNTTALTRILRICKQEGMRENQSGTAMKGQHQG